MASTPRERARFGHLRLAIRLALAAAAGPAAAATIIVDSFADEVATNGTCTLREAVLAANADAPVDGCVAGAGADTILLPAGTYALSIPGVGETGAQTGDLGVTGSLVVQGAGSSTTFVQGFADRVFYVGLGAALTLSGLTVEGGAAQFGGGIRNDGDLTLRECIVRLNQASVGGGVMNGGLGTVSVLRSAVAYNTSTQLGGGGIANFGTLTVENSTVSGNACTDPLANGGGGILNAIDGILALRSATLGPNAIAGGAGAALLSEGTVTSVATLFLATGSCAGGGLFDSLGHNLEGEDTCHLAGPGDLPSTIPLFGPLADDGYGTPTHPLLRGSPGIDAGDPAACPATDQRGQPRPQDGDADGTPVCDIGAYELETQVAVADLAVYLDASPNPVVGGEPFAVGAMASNAGPDAAYAVVLEVTLPAGASLIDVSPQGSCTGAGPFTCALGTLASGAGANVTFFLVAPAAADTLSATATVTSGAVDPVPSNDAASLPVVVDPPYDAVVVTPASASVQPGETLAFSVSGGTGEGWTWWIDPNGSGGTIDPQTGLYTAGPTAGVTDTVRVNDSVGHAGSAAVSVVAPEGGGGCSCGGGDAPASGLLALLALLAVRGRRRSA